MKNIFLSSLFITLFINVQAQECEGYVPQEEGTIIELTDFDKKGKVTSIRTQNLKSITNSNDTTIYNMETVHADKSGKEASTYNLVYKCFENIFYIDMSSFVNQEQMSAYKDMDVKMTMDDMELPSNLRDGQKLRDGTINVKISGSDLPYNLDMDINIVNRKVEGKEEVTTEAGTFQTIKISQTTIVKSVVTLRTNSFIWYSKGVGAIKTESYKENGKLINSSRITKLTKP